MNQPSYEVTHIYEDGDSYFSDLMVAIQRAQKSIYVESYIFELPEPGQALLKALEEKHQQGLDVRLMVDGVGSLRYLQALQAWSERSWVPVKIYNPLPWHRRWRALFFPLFVLNLLWHLRTLNRRDHRKMVVIDDSQVFLGSINFSKVHFKAYIEKPWFDLAVQIKGEQVQILSRAFLLEFERLRPRPHVLWRELRTVFYHRAWWFPLTQKLRLNVHFILRYLYWRDLLRRIRRAQNRVYIMNAYFVPHRTLLRSLIVAARNGADVKVLLPSNTDVPVVKWLAPLVYPQLLSNGVEVREMQNQMIHTKSIIIDEWSLVGSNNLNYRSLMHDLEVDAVVEEPPMLARILTIWNQKLVGSRLVSNSEVASLGLFGWLRYRLVLLLRYFV